MLHNKQTLMMPQIRSMSRTHIILIRKCKGGEAVFENDSVPTFLIEKVISSNTENNEQQTVNGTGCAQNNACLGNLCDREEISYATENPTVNVELAPEIEDEYENETFEDDGED